MDDAGLAPGITSAFRDDYRQSIASGLKAASDRSYHGGSFRGGYGHGLAADIVSVKGETRGQRWISTEILWKWARCARRSGVGWRLFDGIRQPRLGRSTARNMPTNAAAGRRNRRNPRSPSPRQCRRRRNLDRLKSPPACRLHLRARKYRCTSPTDAIGRHQLGSIRVHRRQSLAGRAFARACASRNKYAFAVTRSPSGILQVEENPGGA